MNILLANYRYFITGGPETYLFLIERLLEEAGHKVVPFAFDYRETLPTAFRRYFPPPPLDRDFVFFGDRRLGLADRARLLSRVLYSRRVARAVRRVIREQEIDVVYGLQLVNYLQIPLVLTAHSMGVPVVHRLSDFQLHCPAYKFFVHGAVCEDCRRHTSLWPALRKRCVQGRLLTTLGRVANVYAQRLTRIERRTDAYVVPSRLLRRTLLESGVASDKVFHLLTPMAASAEEMSPTEPLVLYVGQLIEPKGVETLIRAAALIEDPEVRVKIVGSTGTPHAGRLAELAAGLQVRRIEFAGWLPPDEVRSAYRRARAVVVPSLWYENSPNVVLEAFAHGALVVASDVGGIGDLVAHGSTGFLVPPGDAAALARQLEPILADPERYGPVRQAARAWVSSHAAPEVHLQKLLRVLESHRRAVPVRG